MSRFNTSGHMDRDAGVDPPPVNPSSLDLLWASLQKVDAHHDPRSRAQAEDALFRHYLPMVQTLATGHAAALHDPDTATRVAELGLAQAVLAWRHPVDAGFEAFARHSITTQLRRQHHLTQRPARHTRG